MQSRSEAHGVLKRQNSPQALVTVSDFGFTALSIDRDGFQALPRIAGEEQQRACTSVFLVPRLSKSDRDFIENLMKFDPRANCDRATKPQILC